MLIMKNWMKISVFFALMLGIVFVSCEKPDQERTEDELLSYLDESLFNIQDRGNIGRNGCYELVFPVTVLFEDETSQEVNDYSELRDAIRTWKENNPDATERPSLAFPIEVISDEGELISVTNEEELLALREDCPRGFFNKPGHHGHRHRCKPCFNIVFPISISFPDDSVEEVANRMELKQTIRAWKAENPDAEERQEVVFPIEVELEDGTVVTINSKEELEELKDSCSED